jgi:hypothetical protein
MYFLGVDLMGRNFWLAGIAVITQFIQLNLALPKTQRKRMAPFRMI